MKNDNSNTSAKTVLILLTILCAVLIGASLLGSNTLKPVKNAVGLIVTPVQRGISQLGEYLGSLTENVSSASQLRAENEALKQQVDTLTAENSQLVLDKEELSRLRELVDLADTYAEYETIGAHVISKDSGNWFTTFTIDKGTDAGISVDCNVLAGSGLVGIVTDAGPNWAVIRTIIDDNSNVSAMVSNTSDTCIIAGNLELIDSGSLNLVKLTDEDNKVHVGDKVVTSNISEKFLPGILIGYISQLNNDPNNLTKSGEITPVVDFKHLSEVLVILEKKEYVASPDDGAKPVVNDVDVPTGTAEEEEDVPDGTS